METVESVARGIRDAEVNSAELVRMRKRRDELEVLQFAARDEAAKKLALVQKVEKQLADARRELAEVEGSRPGLIAAALISGEEQVADAGALRRIQGLNLQIQRCELALPLIQDAHVTAASLIGQHGGKVGRLEEEIASHIQQLKLALADQRIRG